MKNQKEKDSQNKEINAQKADKPISNTAESSVKLVSGAVDFTGKFLQIAAIATGGYFVYRNWNKIVNVGSIVAAPFLYILNRLKKTEEPQHIAQTNSEMNAESQKGSDLKKENSEIKGADIPLQVTKTFIIKNKTNSNITINDVKLNINNYANKEFTPLILIGAELNAGLTQTMNIDYNKKNADRPQPSL